MAGVVGELDAAIIELGSARAIATEPRPVPATTRRAAGE
jgi:hypothetical protein